MRKRKGSKSASAVLATGAVISFLTLVISLSAEQDGFHFFEDVWYDPLYGFVTFLVVTLLVVYLENR